MEWLTWWIDILICKVSGHAWGAAKMTPPYECECARCGEIK